MPHDALEPIIITTSQKRRKARRRLRIAPLLWRLVLGATAALLAFVVISRALSPYAMRHHQKQETRELREALARAKDENRLLKHELHRLQTGQGLEAEARRLGYIRPGEVPLKITVAPPPAKQ